MNKSLSPRIIVLYGGVGPERDISLISGKAVMQALEDYRDLPVLGVKLDTGHVPDTLDPATDVVLPVLHGKFGEDGVMQRELAEAGFIFCGSDSRSSELCMDKARAKALLEENGVPVVPGLTFGKDFGFSAEEIVTILGESIVAKPVANGSSIGLCLIDGVEPLESLLEEKKDDLSEWLLEQRVFGREFSIGVLDGKAMGIVEIIVPEGRVYDYEQKYYRDDTRYECPAAVSPRITRELQDYAEQAFAICNCQDYARIDFLWDAKSDERYCLELNTIPGMTPSSLLPKSAGAVGLDFRQLLTRMMAPAITRYRERSMR